MGSDDYDDNDEREKQRLIDHVEKTGLQREVGLYRTQKESWVMGSWNMTIHVLLCCTEMIFNKNKWLR